MKTELTETLSERLRYFIDGLPFNCGVVAGGALRRLFAREKPADIDVFCRSLAEKRRVLDGLDVEEDKIASEEYLSQRHVIVKNNMAYDIVAPLWKDISSVLDAFDMTVAQVALEVDTGYLIHADTFWQDLAGRRIIFTPPLHNPFGTLMRVQKYVKNGYSMCVGQARVLTNELRSASEAKLWTPVYID